MSWARTATLNRITATPPPAACSYSISPTNQIFSLSGGEGTITLTTAGTCGWLAAANVEWITLESTRGVGNTTLNFVVRDNPSSSPRTGIIHVAGQTFTIVQNGTTSSSCSFELTPSGSIFFKRGRNGNHIRNYRIAVRVERNAERQLDNDHFRQRRHRQRHSEFFCRFKHSRVASQGDYTDRQTAL